VLARVVRAQSCVRAWRARVRLRAARRAAENIQRRFRVFALQRRLAHARGVCTQMQVMRAVEIDVFEFVMGASL
jgi:hypothetical protein